MIASELSRFFLLFYALLRVRKKGGMEEYRWLLSKQKNSC
jgi:hypothetical protein